MGEKVNFPNSSPKSIRANNSASQGADPIKSSLAVPAKSTPPSNTAAAVKGTGKELNWKKPMSA